MLVIPSSSSAGCKTQQLKDLFEKITLACNKEKVIYNLNKMLLLLFWCVGLSLFWKAKEEIFEFYLKRKEIPLC